MNTSDDIREELQKDTSLIMERISTLIDFIDKNNISIYHNNQLFKIHAKLDNIMHNI